MEFLPPELLCRIAIWLPFTSDILRWSQCSRYLQSVLKDPVLFKLRMWDPNTPGPASVDSLVCGPAWPIDEKKYWTWLDYQQSKLNALLLEAPHDRPGYGTVMEKARDEHGADLEWLLDVGEALRSVLSWDCAF